MIAFPNSKINLGLNIIRKREDGFHDLETIFYPIPFTDALEIIESRDADDSIQFSASGLMIDGKEEDNLCIKAWHLLKKDHPSLPAIKMHLHKAIPMGAGLGGGSSDGAFALKLMNDKFGLGLSTDQLINYAASLGSDGPFFIQNEPAYATGRGDMLKPIAVDLASYYIVLINPGIHVNTGQAFSKLSPAGPKKNIRDIIRQPIQTWKDEMINDFEVPVMDQYPAIKEIKDGLYNMGALFASMSGSGSTVYGIFKEEPICSSFAADNYFVRVIKPLTH